jgi:osmotically-inducible protein OsmY
MIYGATPAIHERPSCDSQEATVRSDADVERDVRDEMEWNPDLDSTDIAISVKNGVVTLAGFVRSYLDKYEAETAAKRVVGVSGIANDIEVRVPSVDQRPDPDLARDAVMAIRSQLPVSSDHIKVVVKNGWVNLEGETEWQYQRQTAENASYQPHHAVPHNSGFLGPVEMSLTSRGFGAGDVG